LTLLGNKNNNNNNNNKKKNQWQIATILKVKEKKIPLEALAFRKIK